MKLTEPDSLSLVLIGLMKGVIYQENDATLWRSLLSLQARVRDHVSIIGLELILDEGEGHAYLRQNSTSENSPELPRLVPRRPLGYHVSLLLALLRKKLAEFDATSGDARLILSRDDIVEQLRLFLPDSTNEVRTLDRIDAHINKVVEIGFLRRLRGPGEKYEVRRILKSFVDAQWLNGLEVKLAQYRDHLASASTEDTGT